MLLIILQHVQRFIIFGQVHMAKKSSHFFLFFDSSFQLFTFLYFIILTPPLLYNINNDIQISLLFLSVVFCTLIFFFLTNRIHDCFMDLQYTYKKGSRDITFSHFLGLWFNEALVSVICAITALAINQTPSL